MSKSNYDDSSIRSLKGAERVRQRPGVIFGSDDLKGAFHSVKELIGNSTDEARDGYGNVIEITLHKDNSISLRDYGRGVPMGWNDAEKRYNWDLIFNELYAGGKYDDDDDNYKYSVGLNGLGAASTQYVSEFFDVTSYKGDKIFKKSFKKGIPTDDDMLVEENNTGETGTLIRWKLDDDVFSDTKITFNMLVDYCEGQAHINKVTFKLYDEATDSEVVFEGQGIENYLKDQLGDSVVDVLSKVMKSNGIERKKKYDCECEVVLAITEETSSKKMYFHNTATMSTGVHINAVNDAITEFFRGLGKRNGVTISPYDYNDYLSVVVSTYSNITSFANQTKDGVSNLFIYSLINDTVKEMLAEAVAMGKSSINDLMTNVLNAALARKKAKEIEAQERQIKKTLRSRTKPEKFVDCRSKDPSEIELYIVEGDSALGSCKQSRNGKTQCLLPIKGKIINCLKKPIDDILKNQEVKDIISAIGCAPDIGNDNELFDIKDLKVSKIIICTDADVDGYQIRVLLFNLFVRLYPQLVEQGYVHIVETPLFELETSRGSYFAYNIAEKEKLEKKLSSQGIAVRRVNRSKGLGENDPEMMRDTTMNPETRRLVTLSIDYDMPIVRDIVNMLFGNDKNNDRKDFIFNMLSETGVMDLLNAVDAMDVEGMDVELALQ